MPLVTIFAICHKHKSFLIKTLDSIRRQTYPHIELIILENASNDGSAELINEWIKNTGQQCNFLINPEPYSITKNCNIGLSLATGSYFQVISCDDLLLADKIESQVNLFKELKENFGCIYGDVLKIDESGNIISTETEFSRLKRILHINSMPSGNLINELSERPFIHAPSVLCKTSALKAVGGYDETLVYEDWAMWIALSKKGFQFAPINQVVVHYRILSNSLDRNRSIDFYFSTISILRKNKSFLNMKLKGAHRQWLYSILQISKFSIAKAVREYLTYVSEMHQLGIRHLITVYRYK